MGVREFWFQDWFVLRTCTFRGEGSDDMLAWATGTRVGTGDHAIALFCIECGHVLGFLYSDTLHFEVELHTLMNILLYMWL